ncbi:hypothetical protein [Jeotgalibacillus malaysiensis]|uniref:hypothetical protein n=1 Tax=Jeotgalibacillus malaysiensis TaxID=1508404 RepID=UPI00384B4A01
MVQEINPGVREITLVLQEISSAVPEIGSFDLPSSLPHPTTKNPKQASLLTPGLCILVL